MDDEEIERRAQDPQELSEDEIDPAKPLGRLLHRIGQCKTGCHRTRGREGLGRCRDKSWYTLRSEHLARVEQLHRGWDAGGGGGLRGDRGEGGRGLHHRPQAARTMPDPVCLRGGLRNAA